MWCDELPGKAWTSLWSGYVVCGGDCPGIRKIDASCPACGSGPFDISPKIMTINGEEMVIHPAFAGAEGRYEDYIYLLTSRPVSSGFTERRCARFQSAF
jgi:hypothetical protein